MATFVRERPAYLFRQGRPVVPQFEVDEALYRRYDPRHRQGHRLLPAALSPFPLSVNRGGRFSRPEDVLFPDKFDWGIASFKVKDVPEWLAPDSGEPDRYDFRLRHTPKEDNYAHSEVCSFKNGCFDRNVNPQKTVRKQFRLILSEKIVLVR